MVTLQDVLRVTPLVLPKVLCMPCAECGEEWPVSKLHGIQNQDDANRISGLLEVDPDSDMCPDCRKALIADAREAICHHCHRPSCPGPIIRTDVDRYECPDF